MIGSLKKRASSGVFPLISSSFWEICGVEMASRAVVAEQPRGKRDYLLCDSMILAPFFDCSLNFFFQHVMRISKERDSVRV